MPEPIRFGYKLMSEEHGPLDLVRNAVAAEQAGFDFVAISDHFHPWVEAQGHSPHAWTVLGAIAQATERVGLMTAVTCPFVRYHPAIVAQSAATLAVMSGGRFRLGLGSGEALNERIVGEGWPPVEQRQEMLEEAVEMIRLLWSGEKTSFHGTFRDLEHARLYDLPSEPPPIAMAAGGVHAARLAAELEVDLISNEPKSTLTQAYREAGGEGARFAEVGACWAKDEKEALRTVKKYAPWASLGWKVLPELAEPAAFEQASQFVRAEDLADSFALGPKLEKHKEAIDRYVEAGFDHLILLSVGPEQKGFLEFCREELLPAYRR